MHSSVSHASPRCSTHALLPYPLKQRQGSQYTIRGITMPVSTLTCLFFSICVHLSFLCAAKAGLSSARLTERSDGLCAVFVLPYRTYACQEFVAETGDGFLLGVQRMSSLKYPGDKKGPVLLFHGILTGGDVWVINPPAEAFAFMLADAGYDVWIGNYRSTTFSYGHVTFQRSDQGFWDWSVDELASEDLPTSLQLIYANTNKKVFLVSYSEGSQAALAAFSEGQAVDLVSKAVLLAPVSYLTSAPQLLDFSSKAQLEKIFQVLHMYELNSRSPGGRAAVDLICASSSVKCYTDWFRLFSGYVCCLNATRRPFIDTYETQATSVKNVEHYSQQIRSKTFAKYDYGFWGNLQRYAWPYPPAYDVSKVPTENTLVISSDRDSLANVADVGRLMKELPTGYQMKTLTGFGHLDFVFGYNANRRVYDTVMEFLNGY